MDGEPARDDAARPGRDAPGRRPVGASKEKVRPEPSRGLGLSLRRLKTHSLSVLVLVAVVAAVVWMSVPQSKPSVTLVVEDVPAAFSLLTNTPPDDAEVVAVSYDFSSDGSDARIVFRMQADRMVGFASGLAAMSGVVDSDAAVESDVSVLLAQRAFEVAQELHDTEVLRLQEEGLSRLPADALRPLADAALASAAERDARRAALEGAITSVGTRELVVRLVPSGGSVGLSLWWVLLAAAAAAFGYVGLRSHRSGR